TRVELVRNGNARESDLFDDVPALVHRVRPEQEPRFRVDPQPVAIPELVARTDADHTARPVRDAVDAEVEQLVVGRQLLWIRPSRRERIARQAAVKAFASGR